MLPKPNVFYVIKKKKTSFHNSTFVNSDKATSLIIYSPDSGFVYLLSSPSNKP